MTTVIVCSLGCASWSFNLVGLTAAFEALHVASCAPYALENSRIFYSLAFFDALYPLSVCALVFCKFCVADRLLRFNVASPSASFVKREKAVVALIVAASSHHGCWPASPLPPFSPCEHGDGLTFRLHTKTLLLPAILSTPT